MSVGWSTILSLWRLMRWAVRVPGILAKLAFLPAYQRSHEQWLSRHALGAHWTKLGHHLEYSVHLPVQMDASERSAEIALRSTKENLDRVSLLFEAEGPLGRYQQQVSARRVGAKPVVVKMENIPRLAAYWPRGGKGWPIFLVETAAVLDLCVLTSDGHEYRISNRKPRPMWQSWLLHSRWTRIGGQYLNLNLIEDAKREIGVFWHCAFQPQLYVSREVPKEPFLQRAVMAALRGFAWLMSRKPMVSVQFWLATWTSSWPGMFYFDGNYWQRRRRV